MTKYRVDLTTVTSFTLTVEAPDAETATDKAFDMAPTDVCAQCGGWGQPWSFDLGEWEIATDDKGKEIGVEEVTDD